LRTVTALHPEQVPRGLFEELRTSRPDSSLRTLGNGAVRFRAGDFVSDITFDPQGFVVSNPGIGTRA